MRKVPKLRFKEFTDEWEEKKLEEYLVEYKEKVSYTTKLPVLTSSRKGLMFQNRYYDNRELKNETEYGLLPRGYFTYRHMSDDLIFKFNINNIVEYGVVSKEYPIFTTKNLNSWFLYYILNYGDSFKKFAIEQKQGGTRTRLYFKKLLTFAPKIASLQEQEKIANFLFSIDKKISLTKEKLELFREYKKGVMQKIFSQELRFKDSEGNNYPEWEEKRLGDILEEYNEKTTINNQYLTLSSTATGIYLQEEYFNRQIASTNNIGYKILKKDQLVFSPQNLWLGNININTKYDIGMVSPSYKIFNLKNNIILVNYFKNLIRTPKMLEEYKNASEQGASIVRRNLDMNQFNNIYIQLPCYEEQQKIADFLSSIDSKIESIEKELEELKEFKRGLLQQMFV